MASITVRVQPGASKEGLWFEDGVLRARVTARATDGAANARLLALLAKRLRVPRTTIAILRGATSRQKVLEVETLELPEIQSRLAAQAQHEPRHR